MRHVRRATPPTVDNEQTLSTNDDQRSPWAGRWPHDHDSLVGRWLTRGSALSILLIAIVLLPVTPVAARERSPSALQVEINNDTVKLEARDVTVRELVTEIARRTDLVLLLSHPLDDRITIEIDGLSLPNALARLLKHKNFALQYAPPLSGTADAGGAPANWLWVLPPNTGDYPQRDQATELSSSYNTSRVEIPQAERANMGVRPRREAFIDTQAFDGDEAARSFALVDEDTDVRVKRVHTLADVGGDQAITALVGALGDENSRVRAEAAHALGDIGGDSAVEILEQPLHDADKHVRQAAIEALTDIGGDDAAKALAVALYDEDATVRKDAVYALREIGGNTATAMVRQAANHPDPAIRHAAVKILADLARPVQ